MNYAEFVYPAADGVKIQGYKWAGSGEKADLPGNGVTAGTPQLSGGSRGVVQLAHGMAEHAARYHRFARALVGAGFTVYANDHRGHGKTAGSPERLGFFAERDGWDKVVEDMYCLTGVIRKENPGLPLFLFGHSMGSFLSRDYISRYGAGLSGVILSGTAGDPGFMGKIGLLLVKIEILFKGQRAKSPLLNRLSFGSYNQAFKPAMTEYDWLSRDRAEVDKYIADPCCGGVFTGGFFHDLLSGLARINNPQVVAKIPRQLPIYLISGEEDPVGGNTRGVLQLIQQYNSAGLEKVSYRFYPGCRHELLHELNREEVTADIIDWLERQCK